MILAPTTPREEILRTCRLFMASGDVHEVRVPKAGRRGTIAGYFDDAERLADAVLAIDGTVPGVYFTTESLRSVASRPRNEPVEASRQGHHFRREIAAAARKTRQGFPEVTIINALYCPTCQKWKAPSEIITMGPEIRMCRECSDSASKGFHVGPGCEECGKPWTRNEVDKSVVHVIHCHGRFFAFCSRCAGNWERKRMDMFQGTPKGKEIECRLN